MKREQIREKILSPVSFLVLVIGFSLFFGLSHVGKFMTADEGKWVYERIPQYWDAIAHGDLERTFINDKPGVSLALISAPAVLFYPESENQCVEGKDKLIDCTQLNSVGMLQSFRIPLVLVNTLLLFFFFFIISKLTNPWVALWSTSLIGLSPVLLGISQIVNPDALLWSFGSASLFSFLAVLKFGERKYIALTGIFLGLALLSKYVALILIPFYGFLLVAKFLLLRDQDLSDPRKNLLSELSALGIATVGALFILTFFLPAFIVEPDLIKEFLLTIEGKSLLFGIALIPALVFFLDTFVFKSRGLMILRSGCQRVQYWFFLIPLLWVLLIATVIALRYLLPQWEVFTTVRFDIKELTNAEDYIGRLLHFHEALIFNLSPYVFSLTPLTLLGLGFLIFRMKERVVSDYYYYALVLPVFGFFYSLLLLYTNVAATIRYSILLYPMTAFLAALGFWHFSKLVQQVQYSKVYITLGIIGISLVSVYSIKPFYFNYTNALLPEGHVVTDAWGYGGYEAAEYLNSLPNAESLTVWADYYGFCEFFVGKCLTAYNFDRAAIDTDYYVLTRRGRIRYWSRYTNWERNSGLVAYQYYDKPNPAWEMYIGGKKENYVRVVKVEK